MSNPNVSISLDLDTQNIKADLAEVKATIQKALGKVSLSGLTTSIKTNVSAFRNWSGTIGEAATNVATGFTRIKNTIKSVVGGSVVVLKALPDLLDGQIYKAVDKVQRKFLLFKYHAKTVKYLFTTLDGGKQIVNSLKKSFASLPSTFKNIKIRPGIIIDAFAKMGVGVLKFKVILSGLKSVFPLVGAGLVKLGGAAKRLAVGIGGAINSVRRFVFSLKGLAAAVGIGAGFWAIFDFAKTSEEFDRANWKFEVIFNEITAKAQKTAKGIADMFKVNVSSIQSQMARSADVTKPIGMDQETVLEITRNFAMLSQSAEAWTEGRYDAERASTALMKALTGEKEMLKEFGISIKDQEIFDQIKEAGKLITPVNFAIAMYNTILAKTPDMQKAATQRIIEFTGRLSQLREAVEKVKANIGDFFRPMVTSLMNLGAVIGRKFSEWMGSSGFNGWKDVIKETSEYVDNLAARFEKFDVEKLTTAFEKWKETFQSILESARDIVKNITQASSLSEGMKKFKDAFVGVAKAFLNALGRGVVVLAKTLAETIGPAIAQAVKFGIQVASDVSKVRQFRAESLLTQEAQANLGMTTQEPDALGFMRTPIEHVDPVELKWATGFMATLKGVGVGGEPKNVEDQFLDILIQMKNEVKELAPKPPKSEEWIRFKRPKAPDAFATTKLIPLQGPDVDVWNATQKRQMQGMEDAQWRLGNQKDALQKQLDAGQGGAAASMAGLSASYFSRLTAAAGKKSTPEEIEKMRIKMEDIDKKNAAIDQKRNDLLQKIADNSNKDPADVLAGWR